MLLCWMIYAGGNVDFKVGFTFLKSWPFLLSHS